VEQPGWTEVVAAAVRAPSIHNTQPWTFTASAGRLELRLDRERALPVLDPTGRQQVISCGAAVEFALVALRAAGHEAAADLVPDRHDPDLLAAVRLTGAHEPTEDDRALRAAIDRRHTVRAAFEPRPVPPELLDRWARELDRLGVWVKPVVREDEEVAAAVLLSQAEALERTDPGYLAELERWLRTDPAAVDGIPRDAVPGDDPAQRPSNWLVRDFIAGERPPGSFLPPGDGGAPPPAVERPAVLLVGTANDDRAAWLLAGRALGRLLLRATQEGIVASPLTQALDWPATRTRGGRPLSVVGHPQMLLRLGYSPASGDTAVSGRRPVADVLRVVPG
jgi:hypothetical protein